MSHVKKIFNNHGYSGFFRGYTGCFYQGLLYGFTFFLIYKDIKDYMHEKFEDKFSPALVSVVASTIGETLTLGVCFPFELVKARLMSKNHIF